MGSIVVLPHKSADAHKGYGGPLVTKVPSLKSGGKVRIGYGDGTKVLGFKVVSLAPVFDPDAVSMVPIPGWKAPVADMAKAA